MEVYAARGPLERAVAVFAPPTQDDERKHDLEDEMSQIDLLVKFEVLECGGCGQSYALTKSFLEERRSDHKTFYCPNADARHYPLMSENEKLQHQNEHFQPDREI